jgi:hypothetical protein
MSRSTGRSVFSLCWDFKQRSDHRTKEVPGQKGLFTRTLGVRVLREKHTPFFRTGSCQETPETMLHVKRLAPLWEGKHKPFRVPAILTRRQRPMIAAYIRPSGTSTAPVKSNSTERAKRPAPPAKGTSRFLYSSPVGLKLISPHCAFRTQRATVRINRTSVSRWWGVSLAKAGTPFVGLNYDQREQK